MKEKKCATCGFTTDDVTLMHLHLRSMGHEVAYDVKPESDGQAEQHLGSTTMEYDYECTPWFKEQYKKMMERVDANKTNYKTFVLGEWGKDEQPTNKYDNGKPRLDLVPPAIIEAVGEIRTYGVGKYGDSKSWHTVEPERYRAAMMRHLCAYLRDPKSKDEESGLSHLSHAACNIAFLLELEKEEKV